jgi:hypothetical protein
VLLAAVACAAAVWPLAGGGRADGQQVPADVRAIPELGVASGAMTLLGAVPAAQPAETWGWERLPLDAPPPRVDGVPLAFGPAGSGAPDPQLAFLRHTDAAGWQVRETPLDELGRPYRGMNPNPRAGDMIAGGGGLLVGQDTRRPPGQQVVVLRRHPGGRFAVLPGPPPGVLRPAGDPAQGDPAEELASDGGSGRVAAAPARNGSRTAAFFGILGRPVEDAVAYHDGEAWHREPIEVAGAAQFRIAAIAATSLDDAWLLGHDDASGVRLFHRRGGDDPAWEEVDLGAVPWADPAAAAAAGISGVRPVDGRSRPLTATGSAVWIDVTFTRTVDGAATEHDATLHVAGGDTTAWCDAGAGGPCEHPLGFAFSRSQGYRSFAWAGQPFGQRVVTNPLRAGEDDTSNRGAYVRLTGDEWVRMPGAGGNFQPSGAFRAPDDGWLGGPVRIARAGVPVRTAAWPVPARAPLTDAVPAPGQPPGSLQSGALAVGSGGTVLRFNPPGGWEREFLLSSTGAVVRAGLRGVAWPEPARAHAVADLGAMWLWRADTGLWERDPATPVGLEANLLDVAFDPADPYRGYAVGKGGALLRYDKTWTQEPLPPEVASADLTQVAFAGHDALAAAGGELLVNDGRGWRVDAQVHELLASVAAGAPRLYAVAGLPDGGAVVAGRNIALERDGAGQPWRFADQPLLGATVVAVAPFRDGDRVRALASVVPRLEYPVPDPPIEVDPNTPPPILPPFQLPGDGYVVRESATGWRDEQHTAFGPAGTDRPMKSDPVAALVVDANGEGWLVGGWSGTADFAGRGTSGRGGGATSVRAQVQTAAVLRYSAAGTPAGPPRAVRTRVELAGAKARFAVGGHAECDQACAELAGQGIGPDRTLTAALDRAAEAAAGAHGPRAFLYTGGRSRPDAGPQQPAEALRFADLLRSRPRLPVYAAVSAGDAPAGAAAFRSAFTGAAAPFGPQPSPPPGVTPVDVTGVAAQAGARTHYAFDSHGPAGTVRVVVIDNAEGSLAAADARQNPPESQRPWLIAVLDDARASGIPAIVVGSRDLNPASTPPLNVASDGQDVAALLVEHGASAYFYERPEENRAAPIPAGAAVTIPAFGTGTLGYRSFIRDAASVGRPDALFGDAGFLLAEIDVAARDAATNRAPVTARLIPVLDALSLDAVDGTLLRRSRPALFRGLGRRPVAGDRWGAVRGDGVPSPAGSDPYTLLPPDPCQITGCATRVVPEYRFTSSDPDIGDFVRTDPQSSNLRKPLLGPDDKVISDASSGLFCPFNAGTTTVTVSAGGLSYSQVVTVLGGSVQRPCGTRPLNPDRLRRIPPETPAAAAPPPPPAPPGSPPVEFAPPPPPPPAAAEPRPARRPRPRPRPIPAVPAPFPDTVPAGVPRTPALPPVVPPPPAGFFGQPIPPGGATVRVFEQKREEEAAPEQSSAFAAYRPDGQFPLAPFIFGMLLVAAVAGVPLALGLRRAWSDPAFARAEWRAGPRVLPRTRRRAWEPD